MITLFPGTLRFGIGESFDESSLSPYTTGTFFTDPGMPHYSLTKDEPVVLQIFAIGPSGMNYVNSADEPRKKMSVRTNAKPFYASIEAQF